MGKKIGLKHLIWKMQCDESSLEKGETVRKNMYHCISSSRKYPKGNVGEKELHEGREESLKEAFVIIVIINGKEFGRTHQFQGTREYHGTTSSGGSSPPFPSHCSSSQQKYIKYT